VSRRVRRMLIAGFLLFVLVALWVTSGIKVFQNLKNEPAERHAIRGVSIEIDPSQQESLFTQLYRFSEKWGYWLDISTLDPQKQSFDIDMQRADVRASGIYLTAPGKMAISFYSTDPATPVAEQTIDREMADLKALIQEIPGAKFSIGKQNSPP
jgi:hypothetical protein